MNLWQRLTDQRFCHCSILLYILKRKDNKNNDNDRYYDNDNYNDHNNDNEINKHNLTFFNLLKLSLNESLR